MRVFFTIWFPVWLEEHKKRFFEIILRLLEVTKLMGFMGFCNRKIFWIYGFFLRFMRFFLDWQDFLGKMGFILPIWLMTYDFFKIYYKVFWDIFTTPGGNEINEIYKQTKLFCLFNLGLFGEVYEIFSNDLPLSRCLWSLVLFPSWRALIRQ